MSSKYKTFKIIPILTGVRKTEGLMEERESFKSRLGFLLVSAGCAIGIGNVWKFPWLVGQYGGGFFVLFYVIFLIILGIPVLSMEISIGRASRKSTVNGFRTLEKKNSKWHIAGYFSIAGCYLLLMFYNSVCGWMINYTFKFLTGEFSNIESSSVATVFSNMLASPSQSVIFTVISVAIGIAVCAFGLQKGVERVSKTMMIGLLCLIVILAIHSFTLPGAGEGLKFYLVPSIEAIKSNGLINTLVAAMNQAFFTLSLGICAMEIFGTYMSKDHTLLSESVRICLLDTFVAFTSGLIIFPACFSFGVTPDAGPSLIFVTLPNVFANMKGGRIWGALFFVFMSFAALSTVIAVMENIIASFIDTFGWSRKKSVIVNAIGLTLLSLPVAFEGNLLNGITVIGNRAFLDSWDFIVSNLLLPLGSLVVCIFCTTKYGWGYSNFLTEANTGEGMKIGKSKALKFYFNYILPLLVILIIVLGLV